MTFFRLALLLLLLTAVPFARGRPCLPATLPFEPAQLLATLPASPPDWTVTRSVADTSLGEWLVTRATRVFQAPPASLASTDTKPAPPGEVEIAVVDTAGFTPALADFADFTPGKQGIIEKKFIGGLPAVIIAGDSGREITQVLVSARYIVEITVSNLPHVRAEDWLRTLHFDALPPESAIPATRPRDFHLVHVDELHPENNRTTVVSTTDSKALDAFLKTLPSE